MVDFHKIEGLTRIVGLPFGYRATFGYSVTEGLKVEWEPSTPRFRNERSKRKFLGAYTTERNAFYQDIATVVGCSILSVSLNEKGEPEAPQLIAPEAKH